MPTRPQQLLASAVLVLASPHLLAWCQGIAPLLDRQDWAGARQMAEQKAPAEYLKCQYRLASAFQQADRHQDAVELVRRALSIAHPRQDGEVYYRLLYLRLLLGFAPESADADLHNLRLSAPELARAFEQKLPEPSLPQPTPVEVETQAADPSVTKAARLDPALAERLGAAERLCPDIYYPAKAGDFDEAIKIIQAMQDRAHRLRCKALLADALDRSGEHLEAAQAVEGIAIDAPQSMADVEALLAIFDVLAEEGIEVGSDLASLNAWRDYYYRLSRLDAGAPLVERLRIIGQAIDALQGAGLEAPQKTLVQQDRWQAEQLLIDALQAPAPPATGTDDLRQALDKLDPADGEGFAAALDLVNEFDACATDGAPIGDADPCLAFLATPQWDKAPDAAPLLRTLQQQARDNSKGRIAVALDRIGRQLDKGGGDLARVQAQLEALRPSVQRLAEAGLDIKDMETRLNDLAETTIDIETVLQLQQQGDWRAAEIVRLRLPTAYQSAWRLLDSACAGALEEMQRMLEAPGGSLLAAYRERAAVRNDENLATCLNSHEAFRTFVLEDQTAQFEALMERASRMFKQRRFQQALHELDHWQGLPLTPDQRKELDRKRAMLDELAKGRIPGLKHTRAERPEHRFDREIEILIEHYRHRVEEDSASSKRPAPPEEPDKSQTSSPRNQNEYQAMLDRARDATERWEIHMKWGKNDIEQINSKDCVAFQDAWAVSRLIDEPKLTALALAHWGLCKEEQGQYTEALEKYRNAGDVYLELQPALSEDIRRLLDRDAIALEQIVHAGGWPAELARRGKLIPMDSDIEDQDDYGTIVLPDDLPPASIGPDNQQPPEQPSAND
jgi:hypothetical protein